MARFILVSLIAWSLLLTPARAAPGAGPADGASLYFQGKVSEAEAAFQATLDSADAPPLEKSKAALGLARVRWLIDADAGAALADLDRAPSPDPGACAALVMRLRILREAARATEATPAATARPDACKTAGELASLDAEIARADLAATRVAPADARSGPIAAASAAVRAIDAVHAAAPSVQALRLSLALDRSDAAASLEAWRGFFWLTGPANAPQGMAVDSAAVPGIFAAGLKPGASDDDRIVLVQLLIRGGFYDQALDLATDSGLDGRERGRDAYRPVAAYFTLRADLERLTVAFNRATARGRSDGFGYLRDVAAAFRQAAQAVAPDDKDVAAVLKRAFGYFGTTGWTGGYASLHGGHIVQDERMAVVQGARRGEVGFIAIDNLVANGFQSWLWDGMASTGGWATPDVIVQVRSAYTPGALAALDALNDAGAPEAKAKAAAQETQDAALAAGGRVVYLPGLDQRLLMQARRQIAAAAQAKASRSGADFAQVFVQQYWDAVLQHSIRVHEGRHVLDKASYTGLRSMGSPELEYRAKLSELQFSDYPTLALGDIFGANIGDGTPHGVANLRLTTGLRDWLVAHAAEVPGFDPSQPALLQLDKLSDAQLRAFAQRADPENAAR